MGAYVLHVLGSTFFLIRNMGIKKKVFDIMDIRIYVHKRGFFVMQQEWFQESFGEDYLLVYKHRDFSGAYKEVQSMVQWLNLQPGSKLLDLCCGIGRHALALHDSGFDVTGVDLSDVLLQEAKKNDQAGVVRWLQGDMRQVPLQESFDAVVNLFTSFGYFEDDADNERVIAEISRLLRPGGKFIIDFLNPDYVTKQLVPKSERKEGNTWIKEIRTVDETYVRKQIILHQDGEPMKREYSERVRLYRLSQFKQMARQHEIVIERVFGDYDKSVYDEQHSPRMIMVGYKGEQQ